MVLELSRKFGVYLPEDVVKDLEICMASMEIKSKSALVREALKLFINEHRWKAGKKAVGVIGVIYNHHAKDADKKLTDVQHSYLDIVIATMHVHLDEEKCMLAIIVRGNTDRIKKLIGGLSSIKGVEVTRPLLLATD